MQHHWTTGWTPTVHHNITHSQGVLSGIHACIFCWITALSQQGSSHYSMTGKVMCPTPDYRTAGNFTAQLWLLVIPATPAGFNEAVNKLLVVSGGSLYLKVVHLCQIKKLYECLKFGVVNRNNFSVVLLFIPVGSGLIKGMVHTETSRTGG